jgi:hypothetical protein
MRKIKEILRLHHEMGLSRRQIAGGTSALSGQHKQTQGQAYAGMGTGSPRAQTQEIRYTAASMVGVQANKPGWDPVQPILRPLSRMGTQA